MRGEREAKQVLLDTRAWPTDLNMSANVSVMFGDLRCPVATFPGLKLAMSFVTTLSVMLTQEVDGDQILFYRHPLTTLLR